MPYIDPENRKRLDPLIDALFNRIVGQGQVNYCISRIVHLWVLKCINSFSRCYEVLSKGHSVLQDATAEYYRRVMAPYEDKKIRSNRCVSELDDDSMKNIR